MALSPQQQQLINTTIANLKQFFVGLKNQHKKEDLMTEIQKLLEQNAEAYNYVRPVRKADAEQGDQNWLDKTSGDLIAIVGVSAFLIMTGPLTSTSLLLQIATLDSALTAIGYKYFRDYPPSAMQLAEVTRVDLNLNRDKKLSLQALEAIRDKLQAENVLLQKCTSSQKLDTWIGTIAASLCTFSVCYYQNGFLGRLFKPIVADVMLRSVTGTAKGHEANVKELEQAFPLNLQQRRR